MELVHLLLMAFLQFLNVPLEVLDFRLEARNVLGSTAFGLHVADHLLLNQNLLLLLVDHVAETLLPRLRVAELFLHPLEHVGLLNFEDAALD